ncbi:MAG: ComF family protein [Clostridiales bacterium]|nr:ComF family protein [Clostridiales bacterium]
MTSSRISIMDIVFPRRCPLCNEIVIPKEEKACKQCVEKLPVITGSRCKRCSKPIELEEQEYCFDCIKSTRHYEKGFSAFLYEGSIKKSLMDYKFRGLKQYAEFYTEQMIFHIGSELRKLKVDCIIPVPLHNRKMRMRGFNQAELLARGASEFLGSPLINDILIRTKYTIPQKKLDDKERLHNLLQAFTTIKEKEFQIIDKKILIIDDIYTTGSTIEACADVLLKAGCRSVYFATVCIGKGF